MIRRRGSLEDAVFSYYGESQDVGFVRDRCAADPAVRHELNVEGLFAGISELTGASADGLITHLGREPSEIGRSLMLFFWTYWKQGGGFDEGQLDEIRESVRDLLPRVDRCYLDFLHAILMPSGTLVVSEAILDRLGDEHSVKSELVQVFVRCWLGGTYLQRGEDARARSHFVAAREVCERRRFLARLMVVWGLGTLSWQTGDRRAALEIHRDRTARILARRFGKWGWLLKSHNAAAKCALDLGEMSIALEEIEEGERLIRQGHVPGDSISVADYAHYHGQYLWKTGERLEAKRRLRQATQLFKQAGEVRGAMDANVTLAEFELQNREYDVLTAKIRGLIESAERSEYLDLRDRLRGVASHLDDLDSSLEA